MGDANEPANWKSTPVSTHVLVLANAKKLRIELFYDQSQIVHSDGNEFMITKDLNELCSTFEQINPNPDQFLTLMLRLDEVDFEIPNWNSGPAHRFRFGPSLAHAAGESRVEGGGSSAILEDSSSQSVTSVCIVVAVSKLRAPSSQGPDDTFRHRVSCDNFKFVETCSTRGVLVEDENNVMSRRTAPVEILSLNSHYFCTLFFGQGFAEANKQFIEIKNIKKAWLSLIFHIVTSQRFEGCADLDQSVRVLRSLDRFGCVRHMEMIKPFLRNELSDTNLSLQTFPTMIGLSDVLEDQQILMNYLNRYPLAECLNALVEKNVDYMTRSATLLLTQRLTALSKICYSRLKVKIAFNEGEVVCALFEHPHNSPDLASLDRTGSLAVDAKFRVTISNEQAVSFKLVHPLHYAVNTCVIPPLFFASKPMLLQGNRGNHRLLRFSGKYSPYHPYLGVVISGQDLIPNITFARSISIAS